VFIRYVEDVGVIRCVMAACQPIECPVWPNWNCSIGSGCKTREKRTASLLQLHTYSYI